MPTVCGISVTTRSLSPQTGWCSKLLAYAGTALVAPRLQGGRNAPKSAHHRRAGQLGIGSRLQPESHLARRNSAPWYGRPIDDAGELPAAVVASARRDDRITALVRTGSRSRGDRIGRYSDLDLEIITPHRPELFADGGRTVSATCRRRCPSRKTRRRRTTRGPLPERLPPELWRRVHETFGRFDSDDARRALDASADLFADVAVRLDFPWRGELVEGMRRLLAGDRTHRRTAPVSVLLSKRAPDPPTPQRFPARGRAGTKHGSHHRRTCSAGSGSGRGGPASAPNRTEPPRART